MLIIVEILLKSVDYPIGLAVMSKWRSFSDRKREGRGVSERDRKLQKVNSTEIIKMSFLTRSALFAGSTLKNGAKVSYVNGVDTKWSGMSTEFTSKIES